MRNFREMHIWTQGIDLAVKAYRIIKQLPKEEEYGLKSQVRRAAISIPSNIAEGCSRSSEREFKHYLEISLGSSFEIETNFILAHRLSLIPQKDLLQFIEELHKEQRQINALVTKIKTSPFFRHNPKSQNQQPTAKTQRP